MNLIKRVIVALIFIPLIVVAVSNNTIFRDVFFIAIAIGGFWELSRVSSGFRSKLIKIVVSAFYCLSSIVLLTDISEKIYTNSIVGFVSVLMVLFPLLFMLEFVVTEPKNEGNHGRMAKHLFPFIYILFPITLFRYGSVTAFSQGFGAGFGVFLLSLIWINDSFAYFCGRIFGKRKLMEKVSPKKSVEGFIGGMIFTFIAAVFWSSFFPFIELSDMLVLALIISFFGPAGDLFESALKREYKVKDSSNLIPGHGGILDRFDAFIFSIPLYYLYFSIIIF